MADNFPATPASSGARLVATDQVTYSGDTAADLQLVRLVFGTTGAEGSKAVVELDATHGLFVEPVATERHLGQVGGTTVVVSANFQRPATGATYAIGKLIANNAAAGSVLPLVFNNAARIAGGSGMIRRARLRKTSTGIANGSFRLHLYGVSPTSAVGDNATFSTDSVASYLGAFDIQIDQAFTDGACGAGLSRVGGEINFKLPSGTAIFGFLEARAAYAGIANETFTADLEIIQD